MESLIFRSKNIWNAQVTIVNLDSEATRIYREANDEERAKLDLLMSSMVKTVQRANKLTREIEAELNEDNLNIKRFV
jgi:hypothetical protein